MVADCFPLQSRGSLHEDEAFSITGESLVEATVCRAYVTTIKNPSFKGSHESRAGGGAVSEHKIKLTHVTVWIRNGCNCKNTEAV